MSRRTFFIISACICFLFGLTSLLIPFEATKEFGMSIDGPASLIVRSLGGMIFSMGLLYLLIRQEGDTTMMKRVLLYSTVAHSIGIAISLYGMFSGYVPAVKLIPNLAVHVFMGVGSIRYMVHMRPIDPAG